MEANIIKAYIEDASSVKDAGLKKEDFSSRELWDVYSFLDAYHQKHSSPITLDELHRLHTLTLSGVHESKKEKYEVAYAEIKEAQVTTPVKLILNQMKLETLKYKWMELADEGKLDECASIMKTIADLGKDEDKEEQDLAETSLSVVEKDVPIIADWWLPSLQDKLGGIRRGLTALILARTNAGKSSFMCSMGASLMQQGLKVLHISMSEPETKYDLLLRYYQAEFGVTEQEIKSDLEYYEDTFSDRNRNLLHTFVGGRQYVSQIQEIIEECEPDVVVFDQYQKVLISGKNSMNTQTARTEIVQALQDLQNDFGFALFCVTQAGATAGKYVTELDIDESKTGVPGEFALIIGLGKDKDDVLLEDHQSGDKWLTRYINIAKNKGPMGHFTARLEPRKCIWEEV